MKYSLAALMLVVLAVACDCALLRSARDIEGNHVFAGSVLLLVAGTAGVLFRFRVRRSFWCGYAAFGWCYLLLAFGPWFEVNLAPNLPTTMLLEQLWNLNRPRPPEGFWECGVAVVSEWFNFRTVGHSALALHVAIFGGGAAVGMVRLAGFVRSLRPFDLASSIVRPG